MKQTLAVLAVAWLLGGCGSPPDPASSTQTSAAYTRGRGEALFAAKCNQCHAHPEKTKFSATQWQRILAKMGPRAGLSPSERDDVLNYILATPGLPEAAQ
jgi:mono/diheme cytochrome c family protein